jgi:hypothetical protein
MEEFFPALLSRKKAMTFTSLGRKTLENLIKKENIRFFTTKGGHKRYFRDDLANFTYENLQNK